MENRNNYALRITFYSLMTLLTFTGANAEPAEDALALYHAGLYQEEMLGDLEEAIKVYRQAVESFPKTRAAALAQFRIGLCYEKMSDSVEVLKKARKSYQSDIFENHDDLRAIAQTRAIQIQLRRARGIEDHRKIESTFVDSFEGDEINPYWTVKVEKPSGAILRPDPAQAHGGKQSLYLHAYDSVGNVVSAGWRK